MRALPIERVRKRKPETSPRRPINGRIHILRAYGFGRVVRGT